MYFFEGIWKGINMHKLIEIFLDGNGQLSFIRTFGAIILIDCAICLPLSIIFHEVVAIVSLAGIISSIFAFKAIQTKYESNDKTE